MGVFADHSGFGVISVLRYEWNEHNMADVVHREYVFPNDVRFLAQIREIVADVINKSPFPKEELNMIKLAVDEAVANVMEHAYPDTVSLGAQEIELTLDADDSHFRAVIRDSGMKFDSTQLKDVNIKRHVKEGHNGGLGVYMMRRIMDEVNYSFYQSSCNELQMIKWARK